jgi:hypothetical protein
MKWLHCWSWLLDSVQFSGHRLGTLEQASELPINVWRASLAKNFAIYKSICSRDTPVTPDGVRNLFPYASLKSVIQD